MAIKITPKTAEKLTQKHGVSVKEVEEAFANRGNVVLRDRREEHRSDPPTQWLISETNRGRALKICFVVRHDGVHIRTAYPPNEMETKIYERYQQGR